MIRPVNSFLKQAILFRIIFYLAGLGLVAGCSNTTSSEHQQGQNAHPMVKKVKIDFMSTWGNRKSKREMVESSVREYQFLNQDVEVNLKFILDVWQNTDNTFEYLVNSLKTGKREWDILNIDKSFYTKMSAALNDDKWTQKYLINFEEFEWFRQSHRAAIINDSKFRESFGGILPGPLIEGYYHGLWYNKKVAERIGLQIKPFGMTFDDLLGYVAKAYEYNKTASQKIILLSEVTPSKIKTDLLNSLIISALGEIDTSKIDLKHNLAALKRGLLALEKLAQYHPLDLVATIDKNIDPIIEEKVLFGIYPSTVYNIWQASDKERVLNLIPVELPVFEKPGIFYTGSYQSVWAVFKDAPHRNEAIQLIKYMCSNDIAEKWKANTKNPTGLNLRIDASNFGQDEIDKFNKEISEKYEGKLAIYDIAKVLFGHKSNITIDGRPVLRGEMSAGECYDQIVKQLRVKK